MVNVSETAPHGNPGAAALYAGVAKIDITASDHGYINDPLYVKALALRQGETNAVIITVDAVAIGEIGPIGHEYLSGVRTRLQQELGIAAEQVLINASHCHGLVCADAERRTVEAVTAAVRSMVPVRVLVGVGHEDRIMENRRLRLRNGSEADVRHAYALPPDEQIVDTGPVDPRIGLLRLDRMDGRSLAVLFHFACHPIQGVPDDGITADLSGFAAASVEACIGGDAVALFLQGCSGDVNPVGYKDDHSPRNAEALGHKLGSSVIKGMQGLQRSVDARLATRRRTIRLPAADLEPCIRSLEIEQSRMLHSLRGTSLDLKGFLQLYTRYHLFPENPSASSYRYLHEQSMGRDHLVAQDRRNRAALEDYIANVRAMEELTRIQVNLDLLRLHRGQIAALEHDTIDTEIFGLRIGDFVLIAFPGELAVQIGLDIQAASPHPFTFVSGVSNGYIYYAPTAAQLRNRGGAQEDSDCLLAPEWQPIFESEAAEILAQL